MKQSPSMVAKVISGKTIKGALNYNEQKVAQGIARCLLACRFPREADELNFHEKLSRFTTLNEKNTRTKTNTLHISLNFDPSERLTADRLKAIAESYMERIGFCEQPYLVYEHLDAAHPHLHIVTTLIQENGKRIPIHYLGKNQSETARKEIEIEFRLIKAEDKGKNIVTPILPVELSKAVYGKSETKRSIGSIVSAVTRTYRFTSLAEMNAVLQQFNVNADRGSERSAMHANKGLLYSLVDEKGLRVGIPIKASLLPGKPMLKSLEKQFKLNELLRQPSKAAIIKAIDAVLNDPSVRTRQQFSKTLEAKSIAAIFRINKDGRVYGVTFVDNRQRAVFNGSDLGKPYSATPILQRLGAKEDTIKAYAGSRSLKDKDHFEQPDGEAKERTVGQVLSDLVTADNIFSLSPEAALRLKRRRKKKGRKF